jgi:hypothetical protein
MERKKVARPKRLVEAARKEFTAKAYAGAADLYMFDQHISALVAASLRVRQTAADSHPDP